MISSTATVAATSSLVRMCSSQARLFTFTMAFWNRRHLCSVVSSLVLIYSHLELLGVDVELVRLVLQVLQLPVPLHDPEHNREEGRLRLEFLNLAINTV